IPHRAGVHDWLLSSTAPTAEDAPMPFGLRLRVDHPAHQIRLTLTWRATAVLGTIFIGILLGSLLLGIQQQQDLLLSALSTEQVRALPARPQVLDLPATDHPSRP